MRLIVNSNNYGDIKTAVFYRSHNFIPETDIRPEDLNNIIFQCTSDKILYQGNKFDLINKDFAEYDFSYIINKYKFNDKMLLDLSDNYTKNLVGIEESDIEKTEQTLFPTISVDDIENSSTKNIGYFGTTLIQNQSFFLFETPGETINSRGYYKVELYENAVNSNNEEGTFIETELLQKLKIKQLEFPIITIILGPEVLCSNNPDSMYFSYDTQLIKKVNSNINYSTYEYKKLLEEISMNNVICLFLGKDNKVIDINLSYRAWMDNCNSNRNEKFFNLRNDDYYSTINNNFNLIEKSSNSSFILDKNSDTIVANDKLLSNTILNSKFQKLHKDKYSPYIHYKKGEIVYLGTNPLTNENYTWESLVDNNYGNNPFISTKWVEKKKIDDFFTRRVSIVTDPIDAGSIIPGNNITLLSKDMNVTFIINEELGYKLKEPPCYCYEDNREVVLENVEVKTVEQESGYIKEVNISDWSKFINNPNNNRLIFKYEPVNSLISLYATDVPNTSIAYNDWVDYFGDENFRISTVDTVFEDGWDSKTMSVLPSMENESDLEVYPNRKISIVIRNLTKVMITSVISTYYINNKKKEKEIKLIYENNGRDVIIQDTVDFSKTKYTLHISVKKFNITADKFNGFIVSEVNKEIEYRKSGTIKFYNEIEGGSFSEIKIIDKDQYITIMNKDLNTKKILKDTEFIVTKSEDNIYSLNINNTLSNFKIEIK